MRNLLIGSLSTLALIATILAVIYKFGGDRLERYYTKYIIMKSRQIKVIERNNTVTKFIYVDENLTSEERMKMALGKSDFIIYPDKLTILAFKNERKLEVWGYRQKRWRFIKSFNWTAYSGVLGPKLKEGDRQIPEGIYGIEYLNPNSKFHLSMKVSYPNRFDREMAKRDNRDNLGGDIMIHGSNRSVGCIPIGDSGIEELYFKLRRLV